MAYDARINVIWDSGGDRDSSQDLQYSRTTTCTHALYSHQDPISYVRMWSRVVTHDALCSHPPVLTQDQTHTPRALTQDPTYSRTTCIHTRSRVVTQDHTHACALFAPRSRYTRPHPPTPSIHIKTRSTTEDHVHTRLRFTPRPRVLTQDHTNTRPPFTPKPDQLTPDHTHTRLRCTPKSRKLTYKTTLTHARYSHHDLTYSHHTAPTHALYSHHDRECCGFFTTADSLGSALTYYLFVSLHYSCALSTTHTLSLPAHCATLVCQHPFALGSAAPYQHSFSLCISLLLFCPLPYHSTYIYIYHSTSIYIHIYIYTYIYEFICSLSR